MIRKRFTGEPGITVDDTRYSYEDTSRIPPNAPNVVYIVLDDVGFAHFNCYGSDIETPNINRLAEEGLRYNNFHTTAICSATRASLLTGANHHAAGIGALSETGKGGAVSTNTANGIGHISDRYATIAQILKEYDYATFAVGKWHLAEQAEISQAGPFDNWPLGKGFDRYYGFLRSRTDQFHPVLTQDNTMIDQPYDSKDGYHLSKDLTDHAISFISTQHNIYPEQPFFMYLAYGAGHCPHHAPQEYLDKYKGRFDRGWDECRKEWFARQKKLGIIPDNAELTPRNEYVKTWDSLSDKERTLYAKYMEAYAAFLDYTDHEIGRFINYLDEIGVLDNTAVVLLSDNGASGEGGQEGRFDSLMRTDVRYYEENFDFAYENRDKIGTEWANNHYPMGWGNAGNTPFPWYKTWVYTGGVKDPLIIRYPRAIHDAGGIRSQYHHVIDITPTILDLIGVTKPDTIKGVPQERMHGISMKYTFDNPDEPGRRHIQHYELMGNRAIYKDGWKAIVNHCFNNSYDDDQWELYHVDEDFSEAHNVADLYPEKLEELKEYFLIEGGRYGVFPMLTKNHHYGKKPAVKEALNGGRQEKDVDFEFTRPVGRLEICGPIIAAVNRSHTFEADIIRGGSDGTIISVGNRFSGFSLYVMEGYLYYSINYYMEKEIVVKSGIKVPEEACSVGYRREWIPYVHEILTLSINGQEAGRIETPYTLIAINFADGFIGADPNSAVSRNYEAPYEFGGTIQRAHIHSYGMSADEQDALREFFEED